jgi:hypothetical protein
LLRLDALVLRNGFALAFSGWRDRLLLLIVASLAFLWLRDAAATVRPVHDPRVLAGIGAGAGWTLAEMLRRRLRHQREEGPLAADALDRRTSLLYLLAWGGAAGMLLIGLCALLLSGEATLFGLGLIAGAIAAALAENGANALFALRRRSARNWKRRARLSPYTSALAIAAATAIMARLALARGGETDAALAAAAANAVALFWIVRVDHQLARFHAIVGIGPWRSAALMLAPGAWYALNAAALTAALSGLAIPLLGAALAAALLALGLARVWLFRSHRPRSADMILSLALAAGGMAFVAAPPLALLLVGGLAVALYRGARRATWMMG